jgi:hypothetical protein
VRLGQASPLLFRFLIFPSCSSLLVQCVERRCVARQAVLWEEEWQELLVRKLGHSLF